PEVCDTTNHDEDCDPATFGFRDADGDTYADARCCNADATGTLTCGRDCDDTNPGVHPSAPEVCNGMDGNCDGMIDEGVLRTYYLDCDGDGHGEIAGDPVRCNDPSTGSPYAQTATGCSPPPMYTASHDDCNDDPAASGAISHPGYSEMCDGVDNDCNGVI